MARPRSDIRPRLIAAARAQFLAHGVDGASLREIATKARTNIGMVVYYFPTKDELFLAVVEDVYAKLAADLEAIVGGDAPTRERLRRCFVRIGSSTDREMDVVRLMAREAMSSSKRLRGILERFMRGHVPVLANALIATRHDFNADIPMPFVFAAVIGLGGLPQLLGRSKSLPMFSSLPDAETLADLSIDALFAAVGAKKKRRRILPK